jgi:hypothetical protein
MFRILQGTVGVIFGLAIAASAILSRWIGAVGVFAGVCGYTYCCSYIYYEDAYVNMFINSDKK